MVDHGKKRVSVLAVCTGNICRSPIAEGIMRTISGDRCLSVSSAGTNAVEGNPATEFSVIVAAENGIDISGHRARVLTEDILRGSDIILCMESAHVEHVLSIDASVSGRVFNLAEYADSGLMIPDPYGCSLREYRECLQKIRHGIAAFVREAGLL